MSKESKNNMTTFLQKGKFDYVQQSLKCWCNHYFVNEKESFLFEFIHIKM